MSENRDGGGDEEAPPPTVRGVGDAGALRGEPRGFWRRWACLPLWVAACSWAPTSRARRRATPTLSLSTTAGGATCNDSNPTALVCSGLASGDVVSVSDPLTPGALASIVEWGDIPTQPVIFFLDNDVPVGCTMLSLVTIPSKGATKGDLTGTKTLATGITGPPISGQPTTCTETVPSTTTITGCTTTANAVTDAADSRARPPPLSRPPE